MFNLRVEMRWSRRAKQSCWRGVRELPRRVSPRCQPRPGRWLRRKGACGGFARGFRGEGGLGCLWQLSDSDGRETGASAVPRPSLSNRKWVVDIFSHPPRKTAFSSAELARWRLRCGAVLWLQRLCDATRLHAVMWVVMPTFDDDHRRERTWTDPSKRLSLRERRLLIITAAIPVPAQRTGRPS